ncbi:MAG: endonuclease/exonuclease/phosphatase family protein [Bacteroidia bacterium]|nr:endonuclease/exonuclease/phosphatase family protein [Bacteroidia bacterium]
MKKVQNSRILQNTIALGLLMITLMVIFNAQLNILKWITNYGVQIMLGMLILGFLFFIFGQERLMFSSLICCAFLCLFLQRSANKHLVLPNPSIGSAIKIAHANLTNITGNLDMALEEISKTDADIISLQEVNFSLNERIQDIFSQDYPYMTRPMKENDFWSVAVMSKSAFQGLDTFYYDGIPNIHAKITLDNENRPIHIISAYLLPPFTDPLGNSFQEHLDIIASKRRSLTDPYLVFGDFNVAGWYDEILDFREQAQLMDSRRGYMPAVNNLFGYPVDHIFYSDQLKCIGFEIIKDQDSQEIGILGTYQFDEEFLSGLY